MSDLLMEGSHTLISLAIGGLAGYCVAYVTGLKAVRKGCSSSCGRPSTICTAVFKARPDGRGKAHLAGDVRRV